LKAFLYDVKRYYSGQEYPSENEFIVASDDKSNRTKEASRVYQCSVENAKPNFQKATLGQPQILESKKILESSQVDIDWKIVQQRQLKQCRPQEIGCTFRGGYPGSNSYISRLEMNERRASIELFMNEHRNSSDACLFVGSNWDSETRRRYGRIVLFEACGIELASDIAQLEFLSQKIEITYVNWCCPIYIV